MSGRLRALWNRLSGTLWFVPGGIALAMAALAVGMVELSALVDDDALRRFPRVFGASPDSSRAMLSAIAGAMMTVAGLTFSLTMVAVTQATSQYTPRILRNFMRDRASQMVLGAYVGIFTYCLLVVRTIRSGDEGRFVPSLAVVLGIALAMVGVGALIFFIHHLASGLQASTIIARVTHETVRAVDRLFPEGVGEEAPVGEVVEIAELEDAPWTPVAAPTTGYVQAVDGDTLLRLADRHDLVVRLVPSVGEFVVEGLPILWVLCRDHTRAEPAGGEPAEWRDGLRGVFTVSSYRTVEQDAAFGLRQLVDVALKALSPGINDTTTATTCIDHLGAIFVRLAPRRVESRLRARDGTLRVIAPGPTFESLLALAVEEIRRSAASNVGASVHLLQMLERVASATPSADRRRLLASHIALVRDGTTLGVPSPQDRAQLGELAVRALAVARRGPDARVGVLADAAP